MQSQILTLFSVLPSALSIISLTPSVPKWFTGLTWVQFVYRHGAREIRAMLQTSGPENHTDNGGHPKIEDTTTLSLGPDLENGYQLHDIALANELLPEQEVSQSPTSPVATGTSARALPRRRTSIPPTSDIQADATRSTRKDSATLPITPITEEPHFDNYPGPASAFVAHSMVTSPTQSLTSLVIQSSPTAPAPEAAAGIDPTTEFVPEAHAASRWANGAVVRSSVYPVRHASVAAFGTAFGTTGIVDEAQAARAGTLP
jgi:hypothetical protein